LTSVFTGLPAEATVGPGSGIGAEARQTKCRVVERALLLHRPSKREPLAALTALGGLELAALVGAMLQAARLRVPIVLDGYITTAAALVACALEPTLKGYLIASHASAEPGARAALATLGLAPLLDLELRLGEGSGACLGLSLLRSAVHVHGSMASFATAGIVDRAGLWRHD
jgi:nicotinate-nucleotide--dimethylbenzimidazole phosphoribosyltransferase